MSEHEFVFGVCKTCGVFESGAESFRCAAHPAVEVLDELEKWLDKRQSAFDRRVMSALDLTESQALSAVEFKLSELRKHKGV